MVTCKIITLLLLLFFELFCIFNIALGRESAVIQKGRELSNSNGNAYVNNTGNRSKRNSTRIKLIEEKECKVEIKRLCGNLPPNSDDLFVLECVQSFKVSI
jgi:hypothetical protein